MGSAQYLAIAVFFGIFSATTTEVAAQHIGTFRWQFAPYCNTVTLDVEQRGANYVLTGFDDRCGDAQRSSVNGTAHLNPDGTAGLGLIILRPDGFTVHTTAIINLGTFSGTWSDSYGTEGTFVFNPATPTGPPRPITLRGTYAIDYLANSSTTDGLSAISFGHTLPVDPVGVNANFIAGGAGFTANCPQSLPLPQAAPGHLCVYERQSTNVSSRCIVRNAQSYICGSATRVGAAVYVDAAGAGRVYSIGSWAVTIP